MGQNKKLKHTIAENSEAHNQYWVRLCELAATRYEWIGMPDTVDTRYLEMALLSNGAAVFFKDEVLGYLGLRCMIGGGFDVYNVPKQRRAYAPNGYQMPLDETNSVIIYNNYLRQGMMPFIEEYSERLYEIDRAIDTNIKAQKTPILIRCPENMRNTMKNMYVKYDGNTPVIFASQKIDPSSFTVLRTDAPYVADRLWDIKSAVWHEALSLLGVASIDTKRERRLTNEVEMEAGDTLAIRLSGLQARKQACEKINKMFPELNVDVRYREAVYEDDYIDDEVIEDEQLYN